MCLLLLRCCCSPHLGAPSLAHTSSPPAQHSTMLRVQSPSLGHPGSPCPPELATGLLSASLTHCVLRHKSCRCFRRRPVTCRKLRRSILRASLYSWSDDSAQKQTLISFSVFFTIFLLTYSEPHNIEHRITLKANRSDLFTSFSKRTVNISPLYFRWHCCILTLWSFMLRLSPKSSNWFFCL